MRILFFTLAFLNSVVLFAQQMNVATFNIRMKTSRDVGNLWEERKTAVSDLIKFHSFAVFGVQEAFLEQLEDMQQDLPAYSYFGVGRDDGAQKGEYSAVFYDTSRFALLKEGTFWLSDTDITRPNKGWDAALPRICTWGVFRDKLNDREFIFMNTHFDHIGVEARKESAKLILQKAKELASNTPLILTGDFNVDQHDEAYFTIVESGLVADAYEKASFKYAPNSTFNGWGKSIHPTKRIDHVFITAPFKVHKYGILTDTYLGKFPSDHFPVMVQLAW